MSVDETRDPSSRALAGLVLAAVVQCAIVLLLIAPSSPAFVVTPRYHPGRELDWRAFEPLARRLADGGARNADLATREAALRGIDAEDDLFRLRNETHHLNVALAEVAARLLGARAGAAVR